MNVPDYLITEILDVFEDIVEPTCTKLEAFLDLVVRYGRVEEPFRIKGLIVWVVTE